MLLAVAWSSILSERPVQVIFGLATVAILIAVGVYLVGRIRDGFNDQTGSTSDALSTFRELHDEGELSDEEYRNIKAKLSANLQRELQQPRRKPPGK